MIGIKTFPGFSCRIVSIKLHLSAAISGRITCALLHKLASTWKICRPEFTTFHLQFALRVATIHFLRACKCWTDVKMTFIWEVIVQQALIAISLARVLLQQGSILFLSLVFSSLPRCPLAALAFLKTPPSYPHPPEPPPPHLTPPPPLDNGITLPG